MPSKDFILWFDLETTGNLPTSDIIEIGAVLTDYELNEISDFSATIRAMPSLNLFDLDPVVIDMHTKNGLWRDLKTQPNHLAYDTLEQDILIWLNEHTKNEKQHIPAAGSGISHFDRKYLTTYLPGLNNRLTYWNLDIGVVRRFMELAHTPLDKALVEAKTHRALDDAKAHVQEARVWRDLMQSQLNRSDRLAETARCTSD